MKSDLQIQQDVIDQLEWEPLLQGCEIGVYVEDGIVTLSGLVDSYPKNSRQKHLQKRLRVLRQ